MQSEPQGQGIVVGQVLDGWRLDAELGKGGMGLVYHAIHLQSGVVAALKVLLDDENATVELQRRFRREVKALARLDHPGVVRILAESLDHVPPYFCMELLPGGSLTQRLEWTAAEGRAGLPPERFEQLVRELAAALEVLHAARLLHRDLKPGNVLFTAEGHAKLTDFGMVKAFDLSLLTVTPRVMGTMAYLAPETLRGEPFDVRTDLYQLGVTLFEAATGKRPYTQREIANAWSGVALPPPPSVAQVSLPAAVAMPWLQGVMDRLLTPLPSNRFGSAAELLAALPRAPASTPRQEPAKAVALPAPPPGTARTPLPPPLLPQARARRSSRVSFAMALTATLLLGSACLWFLGRPGEVGPAGVVPIAAAPRPRAPVPSRRPLPAVLWVTTGLDRVRIQLAEPAPPGLKLSFWPRGSRTRTSRDFPAAATAFTVQGLAAATRYEAELAGPPGRQALEFATWARMGASETTILVTGPVHVQDLQFVSSARSLALAWHRRAPGEAVPRLEYCESPDGGATFGPIEEPRSRGHRSRALALAPSTTGTLLAWRYDQAFPPDQGLALRFRASGDRSWKAPATLRLRGHGVALALAPRDDGATELLAFAGESSPDLHFLATARLAPGAAALPSLRQVSELAGRAAGSLRLLRAEDRLLAFSHPRWGGAPGGVWWTLAGPGRWPSFRALTDPHEAVIWFDAAALPSGIVVAYETADNRLFGRVMPAGADGFSPPARLRQDSFVDTSPSLVVVDRVVYLAFLVFNPIQWSTSLNVWMGRDGVNWRPHGKLDLPTEPTWRARGVVACGNRLFVALTGPKEVRLAVVSIPIGPPGSGK